MNPATICSVFRKCGVYPLNPDAIDWLLLTLKLACNKWIKRQIVTVTMLVANLQQLNDAQFSISPEKTAPFQWRFEEGYNLPDDEWIKWLHHAHPDSSLNQTASATKNDILNQTDGGAPILPEKTFDISSQTDNDAQIIIAWEIFW